MNKILVYGSLVWRDSMNHAFGGVGNVHVSHMNSDNVRGKRVLFESGMPLPLYVAQEASILEEWSCPEGSTPMCLDKFKVKGV